jgi:hypothetical protein
MTHVKRTPVIQPAATPRINRLGRFPEFGVNPHSDGAKYCEVVMMDRNRAWRAKVMSLNCTVDSRPLCRAAY